MDGIHDLGGRHGFGKVDVHEGEEQFHETWEARMRAIVNAMSRAPDWNLDWFRHCRELMDPVDYLSRPYLDQWAQTYCAMMINSGWASVDELASGKATSQVPDVPAPMSAAQVKAQPMRATRFDTETEVKPGFSIGDEVVTTTVVTSGHTRLPVYARGKRGAVLLQHGAHVFPDDNALKVKRYEHLYTVEFTAGELWPEAEASQDTISLDLWESYLAAG